MSERSKTNAVTIRGMNAHKGNCTTIHVSSGVPAAGGPGANTCRVRPLIVCMWVSGFRVDILRPWGWAWCFWNLSQWTGGLMKPWVVFVAAWLLCWEMWLHYCHANRLGSTGGVCSRFWGEIRECSWRGREMSLIFVPSGPQYIRISLSKRQDT